MSSIATVRVSAHLCVCVCVCACERERERERKRERERENELMGEKRVSQRICCWICVQI